MGPKIAAEIVVSLALNLAVKAGFIGMALWFEATYPVLSERMLSVYQLRRRRCVLVGVVNLVLFLLLIVILVRTRILAFVGIVLFIVLAGLVIIAYSIGYRDIGARVGALSAANPLSNTLKGGLVAEAAFLAPVVGQLLSLVILLRGLGAAIITLITHDRPAPNADRVTNKNGVPNEI